MKAVDSAIVEFDLLTNSFKTLSFNELAIDSQDKNKLYWIHCDLNQRELFSQWITTLNLPEQLIELCNNDDPIPKLIDSDETLTIQIECLSTTKPTKDEEIIFNSLIIHLTHKFCFTASWQHIPVITEFSETYHKAIKYAKTPCFILFLLMDSAVTEYAKILFNFELITEEMDIDIRKTHQNIYNEVMVVKQQVMKVKRYTIAIREILMRISGRNISVVSEQCRSSLYNLSNHSHMIVNETDSLRDMLNSMLDQIDNALMQKMNETMKILTTFAAIFLPLTLITGIYGMNFQWIPELTWKYGYFYALTLIVVCGLSLFFAFKKMKWF